MKALFIGLQLIIPLILPGQVIDSLHVYFLPWKFNIEGLITDELVRNYPGFSKKISITDRNKIDSLLMSLSILNLRPKENRKSTFSPRMIIDIYSHKKRADPESPVCIDTIKLDSRQNLLYDDRFYYKNFALEDWIQTNIYSGQNP